MVVAIVITMSMLVSGFASVLEYRLERDRLLELLTDEAVRRPDLSLYLYFDNDQALRSTLRSLVSPSPVQYGIVYRAQGGLVMRVPDDPGLGVPDIPTLREGLSAADNGLRSLDGQGESVSSGLPGALMGADRYFHLTLPITSAVNPLSEKVSQEAFLLAATRPEAEKIRHVIGYLHLLSLIHI